MPAAMFAKRTLKRQSDRQARRAERRDHACGLNAELRQHRHQNQDLRDVFDDLGDEKSQRLVEPVNPHEGISGPALEQARQHQADDQHRQGRSNRDHILNAELGQFSGHFGVLRINQVRFHHPVSFPISANRIGQ